MLNTFKRFSTGMLSLLLIACNPVDNITLTATNSNQEPNAERAVEFVAQAEQSLAELGHEAERMAWVYSTFITEDTEKLVASANRKFTTLQVELASQAAGFNAVKGIDDGTRRKLAMLQK